MFSSFLGALQASQLAGPHYVAAPDAAVPPVEPAARLIAYYLPQFHPIPENDVWWGTGFTEWTNVTRAIPRFPGHHQPILPADLGFYDLRLPDTLRAQAKLAKRYGIYGFCFHHYWFSGHRLLQRPVEILLENPDIDLPFCICWANENWTRRWDGLASDILIAQDHSPEDDLAFIHDLMPLLRDPRYIRIEGRPLIVVYRPHLQPDPLATARRWRVALAEAGIGDPYLVMVQGFSHDDPRLIGYDGAVEFPPHKVGFSASRVAVDPFHPDFQGTVLNYEDMVRTAMAEEMVSYPLFRGVCPRWDNDARKLGRGTTFINATPKAYHRWLTHAITRTVADRPAAQRYVFINAWNEWAEGAQLEPDRVFGHAFLSATAEALTDTAALAPPVPAVSPTRLRRYKNSDSRRVAIVAHDAHFHGAQLLVLHLARSFVESKLSEPEILLGGGGELEPIMATVAPTRRVGSGFSDMAAWFAEADRLAEKGVQAVLLNSVASGPALPAFHAVGIKTICLVHELPQLLAEYQLDDTARLIGREADVVVFPNVAVRNAFVAAFGPVSGRTVVRGQGLYRPALPLEARAEARARVRAQLGIRVDEKLILGLGFADRRKGVDLWPSIVKLVRMRHPNARFAWVGAIDGRISSELQEAIRADGLDNALLFPGRTEHPQDYLAASDVFLLTSREDPLPSAALEAMAHGVPVVCFEGSGGIPDLVRETGLWPARMGDPVSVASAICALLDDPRYSSAAGESGARLVQERYNFVDYAEALMQLALPTEKAVTAIIPNYNYARYLRARLESIWSQTHPVTEIIVLDDASTDDSLDVLEELRSISPVPMRVLRSVSNSGSVSRQWLKGMELASTPIVWIAEADDLAEPRFLEEAIGPFDDPRVVLSYTQSQMIDAESQMTSRDYIDYTNDIDDRLWCTDYLRSGRAEIASALAVKNTIPNVSAVLFRREAALPVLTKSVDEMASLRNTSDWLYYIRLLQDGCIAFNAEALNLHRRHAGGVTISAANRRHLDEIARMQAQARRVMTVDQRARSAAASFLRHATGVFGLPSTAADEAIVETELLADDEQWFEAVCATADGMRPPNTPAAMLPGFPPEALQIATTGQAGRSTLREAYQFYLDCREGFARLGEPMRAGDKVVDFGVGWGRIGRFFLRDIRPADLIGLDVDPTYIELCQTLFQHGHFEVCSPMPPSTLPDRSARFVVGYSVFSHLSEESCLLWMREFHRILVPGGIAAVTTRGRWFFDYCDSLARDPNAEGYVAALGKLFPDAIEARQRYDAGNFVFATSAGVSGGGPRDGSFYGETFIPEGYAARAWLPHMELVAFVSDPSRQTHPILFLRRPRRASDTAHTDLQASDANASIPIRVGAN